MTSTDPFAAVVHSRIAELRREAAAAEAAKQSSSSSNNQSAMLRQQQLQQKDPMGAVGDLAGEASVLNNFGVLAIQQGDRLDLPGFQPRLASQRLDAHRAARHAEGDRI